MCPHLGKVSDQSSAFLRHQSEITTTQKAVLTGGLDEAACALWRFYFWVAGWFFCVVFLWGFLNYYDCLERCFLSLLVSFWIYTLVLDHMALCDNAVVRQLPEDGLHGNRWHAWLRIKIVGNFCQFTQTQLLDPDTKYLVQFFHESTQNKSVFPPTQTSCLFQVSDIQENSSVGRSVKIRKICGVGVNLHLEELQGCCFILQ